MQKLYALSLCVFGLGLSCNAWAADQKDITDKDTLTQIAHKHGALGSLLYKELMREIKKIVLLKSLRYQPGTNCSPCQLIIHYDSPHDSPLEPNDIFGKIPTKCESFRSDSGRYSGWEFVLNKFQSEPKKMVLDFKQTGKK